MTTANPFVLPKAAYQRDLRVVQAYVDDASLYLSMMTGKPMEECKAFVQRTIKSGQPGLGFRDPRVTYLERQDNGDRIKKEGTLGGYLAESIRDKELIAPTFTTYLPPSKKKSLLVDFIDANIKGRSKAKKEMFAAEKEGNKPLQAFKKVEQTAKKLSNNALSGAHVSASTPLFNKTAHSTLTSNCRSTSGYGNANNEKFLCGNRHYWSPDIVRNNLMSILNHSDLPTIKAAMEKYGLRAPTAEETLKCITYSTVLYWRSEPAIREFKQLIGAMSEVERAAFVYTGDLYHLRECNPEFVRKFVGRLASRVVPSDLHFKDMPWKEVKALVDKFPEDYHHLTSQICAQETQGKKLEELAGTAAMDIYVMTLENVAATIVEYADLINAFWVTPNVPASLSHFPDSIRRAAITSDTDSTIFTVQEWVTWYEGRLRFTPEACGVAGAMVFLAAQTITHVLARMSANFGIEEERIHQVAMKNEFYFPVFVPTQVAKHYFAIIGVQEGFVKPEFEEEIKGVHLKSSNAPPSIMKEAKKMMRFVMDSIYEEKPISIIHVMKWVARIEHNVMDSIRKGSHEYFRKAQIKLPESYTEGVAATPYQQYLFWKEVFAPKYGETGNPPYLSVKVNAELDSPAKVKEWLAHIEDKELVERVKSYMERADKKHLGTTILLPEMVVSSKGIPEEIIAALDMRKIVLDLVKVFYLILESLGVYMLNDKMTRLVSDEFPKELCN
jgi:hypothetical protein